MTQTCDTKAIAPRAQRAPRPTAAPFVPRVDVVETDDELILYADLPGVKPEDVSLSYRDGELLLSARCWPRQEGRRALYAEYGIGDFHRRFRVNEPVVPDRFDAAMMDGVLAVRLPKADAAKPKRIQVKGG